MLKKEAINKGKTIKVTFYTHKLPEVEQVFLVGDFNEWSETSHPMEKMKDGRYKLAMKLEPEREYAFRYLADGDWHNDWEADKYVPNNVNGDNSIVITKVTEGQAEDMQE